MRTLKHPAAGHAEDLAGDVIGGIGRKEFDGRSNVLRGRGAPHRKSRIAHSASFFKGKFLVVDVGRIHYVYGDAVLGFFKGERTREGHDGGFGCCVGGNGGLAEGALSADRTEIDDSAPALLAHRGKRGFAVVKHTHKIRIQNAAPFFNRGLGDGSPIEYADIVDQDVEAPVVLKDGAEKRFRPRGISGVGFDGKTLAPGSLELAQGVLRRRLVGAVGDGDADAFSAKAKGNAFADAAATAGDQSNALAQCGQSASKNTERADTLPNSGRVAKREEKHLASRTGRRLPSCRRTALACQPTVLRRRAKTQRYARQERRGGAKLRLRDARSQILRRKRSPARANRH